MTRLCSVEGCNGDASVRGTARGMCRSHYKRWSRHGDPMLGGTGMGERQRWIEANKKHEGDSCLKWPFSVTEHGYGQFKIGKRSTLASKVMCEAAHGPAPTTDHQAAHSCGKGHEGCMNPSHLRWATRSENMSDAIEHGTIARGERQGSAKLTDVDVRRIRVLSGHRSHQELADTLSISRQQVGKIVRGEQWAWLR